MKHRPLLGYALNVFPDETLPQLWRTLHEQAAPLQRESCRNEPLPIELRLSAQMTRTLTADAAQRQKLAEFLRAHRLDLVTLNAFVPFSFHEPNVKEKVYLPRWDDGEARLQYSLACADLLAELASARPPFLSLSVPAGVLKRDVSDALRPVLNAAFAVHLARAARHLAELRKRSRRHCILALEAEPGLTCERTSEIIEFFRSALDVFGAAWWSRQTGASLAVARRKLREHIGVNFDTCHHLVVGEDLPHAAQQLWRADIAIAKIHLSNCLRLTRPAREPKALQKLQRRFAPSKFLHQTVALGDSPKFALDLPEALHKTRREEFFGPQVREVRCHYHMPLLRDGAMPTMLAEVRDFARWFVRQPRARGCPLIIETYTWLEQLDAKAVKRKNALRRNIVRELAEARRWL